MIMPFVPVSRGMDAPATQDPVFAPALPTLHASMLLRRAARRPNALPFSDSRTQWFYFCRNAIYALARLWNLRGRTVLFPAYFHGVELDALLAAGVHVEFFPVGAGMEVHPGEVEARIDRNTAAVYLIHYLGFPAPADRLATVCRRHRIPLIEDCALSLLSRDRERPLGTSGDAAVFCLYKTLPTPDGGALVLRRHPTKPLLPLRPPSAASTLAHLSASLLLDLEMRAGAVGRTVRQAVRRAGNAVSRALRADRVATGSQHFNVEHAALGMSPWTHRIAACLDYPAIVERRRRNFAELLGQLRGVTPPIFTHLPAGVCPLFYPMRVPDKPRLLGRLLARGVEAVDFWGLGHPALPTGTFSEADDLRRSVLELPCHQSLTPRAIRRMAAIVREELAR